MSDGEADLIEFLLEETGDTLHMVVEYDPEGWRFLYGETAVYEQVENWDTNSEDVVQAFRDEARGNTDRERLFDVGSFYCSLHLFDELILLHFNQPDERGVIFGYEPSAAANLTTFVELCVPHLRDHALSGLDGAPAWGEQSR
ncbi:hypothetical protein [Saliphagus sp. LR7]|uniref:hypothetical protein n=1 Tax=Saliphagus sp. LR7 TaxID=2282654 RepID=UPI000DF81047|nr:hypothetical protein [Saliphagus sp. LR7]